MENNKRMELDADILDKIAGGALGYDPDNNGTYTMRCQFTGNVYYGVRLDQIIEIAKFGATIPNTLEGEKKILAWAHEKGYI